MCGNSRGADVTRMSRLELARLNLEHGDFWKTDKQLSDEANDQARRFNRRNYRPRSIAR